MRPHPFSPLAEQQRIVAKGERRLSVVAAVEPMVAANLKRAFESKLGSPDQNDEPASALLERIQARRQSAFEARFAWCAADA